MLLENSSRYDTDEDGLFGYAFGKLIQIRHDFILSDVFLGSKPMEFIISAYKSEKIQASSLSGRNEYVLILELPAIRYIPLCTDMAFISEEKVYMPFIAQYFKFFQLFFLVLIALRVGRTLWTKPYSFISRTNVFKKRRSVDSLTVRPVAASSSLWLHAGPACRSRWLCVQNPRPKLSV